MKQFTTLFSLLSLVGVLILQGCAGMGGATSASIYQPWQTQQALTVRIGTVESVKQVAIAVSNNTPSMVGPLAGGTIGVIGGSKLSSGNASFITGALGGVAGAFAGQTIEKSIQGHTAKRPGLQITVRLQNGELLAITQDADEQFRPGERVRLLTGNGITRVTHY